jgi:choline kinase
MTVQVTILAAGMGTRLGRPFPKPLTHLADGRSIMGQQMENIRDALGPRARVTVVVGFKLETIMEAFPEAVFVYNEAYDQTNTSKSLLKALRASHDGGVLWMNGDVVFDAEVLRRVLPLIARDESFVCVNTAAVADEEVKYTVDADGFVLELSKTVVGGLGEAVGINFVASHDKDNLIEHLDACSDGDYFERGIEMAIEDHSMRVTPVDISDLYAVEVDFEGDLERANELTAQVTSA